MDKRRMQGLLPGGRYLPMGEERSLSGDIN
jgi:hypothetical protein